MEILLWVVALAVAGWFMGFNFFKFSGRTLKTICIKADEVLLDEVVSSIDMDRLKANKAKQKEIFDAYDNLDKTSKK
ncbi:hypothetical protein L3M67_000770 [Campylobacter coli]|nr:hypothetical protein [Campylobacter coli]